MAGDGDHHRARLERLPRGRRRFVKLEPLLDELLECVKIVRNPAVDRATGQPLATPLVATTTSRKSRR
jgi:hypothetical protein